MKIRMLSIFSTFLVALCLATNVAAIDYMYKWKDTDGETKYTERPPAPGVPFEKIKVRTDSVSHTPSAPVPEAKKDAPKEPTDNSYSGWRKDNCKIATQNLDILQNAGRIAQDDGQGGTRLMTDEEKQEKIEKMTQQKEKYCDPAASNSN